MRTRGGEGLGVDIDVNTDIESIGCHRLSLFLTCRKKIMRGYLLTGKRGGRWNSMAQSRSFQMLIASLAVGVIAGLLAAHVRLHLGLPGHKAVFWMTPVLLARLLGRCRAGATAGALAAAFTSLALGGNLAGGLIGLPLVGVAGLLFDTVIGYIEKHKITILMKIPLVALCAMSANIIMLAKRGLGSLGAAPHFLFGVSGFWFELLSYAFFGLLAGLVAVTTAYLIERKRGKSL